MSPPRISLRSIRATKTAKLPRVICPLVKSLTKKYSSLPNILIILYCSPSRPTKGALRNVNNAGRDAVDANGAFKTRAPEADGQVVWSWHLDAGVKSAG